MFNAISAAWRVLTCRSRRLLRGPWLLCAALFVSVSVAGVSVGGNVWADTSQDDPRATGLFRTTMSPFCPGRTLNDCPSPYAGEWREDIRKWVATGVPDDEIRRRLYERVHKDLTGTPNTAADSVLPIALTVGSLILLVFILRLLLRPAGAKPNDMSAPSSRKLDEKELDQRLDDELQNLDP